MKKSTMLIVIGVCAAFPPATLAQGSNGADNPAKACKAERTADPAAFAAKYGTNDNDRNAFGKCVSQRAKEATNEGNGPKGDKGAKGPKADKGAKGPKADKAAKAAKRANAAKQCKAERKADPAAFAAKYGTNDNDRNAFGKCVSRTVKASQNDA